MPLWNSKKSEKYSRLSARLDKMEEDMAYLKQMDEKKTTEIKELKKKNGELELKLQSSGQDSPHNVEDFNVRLEQLSKMNSDIQEKLESRLSKIEVTNCEFVSKQKVEYLERQLNNLIEENGLSLELVESVNSLIASQNKVEAIENDIKRSRNDTFNYRQNFSKRLCSLENEYQEETRQVQTTFLQLADLQVQIDEVSKQVDELRTTKNTADKGSAQPKNVLSEQENQLKSMRCIVINLEQRKQICDHLKLTQRMVDFESLARYIKEDQQRVNILESEVTDIRKEATIYRLSFERDMERVEKQMKRLKGTPEEAGASQVDSEDRIGALEKQIQEIQDRVETLNKYTVGNERVSFWSQINTSSRLSRQTWTKIDRCKSFQSPGMNFKNSRGVFKTPNNGLYAISVYLMQEGQGKLRTRLRFDDDKTGSGGSTVSDGDVSASLTVWDLKKGQKISVEVMQVEGWAQVYFCAFSGFLICPM